MNENVTEGNCGDQGETAREAREGLVYELLRLLRKDRLVQSGLVILVLTAALVVFVNISELPLERPFVGLALYALLPLFFVVGGIVFVMAILRH